MSGSWGDVATIDGEIANVFTTAMIANATEARVIRFITSSPSSASEASRLTKKEGAGTDRSVRYDGLDIVLTAHFQ
jgi:hypothetical protein